MYMCIYEISDNQIIFRFARFWKGLTSKNVPICFYICTCTYVYLTHVMIIFVFVLRDSERDSLLKVIPFFVHMYLYMCISDTCDNKIHFRTARFWKGLTSKNNPIYFYICTCTYVYLTHVMIIFIFVQQDSERDSLQKKLHVFYICTRTCVDLSHLLIILFSSCKILKGTLFTK